jgi:hypothetical protein
MPFVAVCFSSPNVTSEEFAARVLVAVTVVGTPATVAVIVSPAAKPGAAAVPVTVIAKTAFGDDAPTVVIEDVFSENEAAAALAGAVLVNTPIPKAATATSAMRLKVVFVDICFLSISRTEEFPQFGLN